ncbi:unnamed protein product [Schistosoma rodhaini]|uniref:Uncharacterized protein n=2 Tax=Schistosoma rodhaini TaxID=6188 RepID=A0AA85F990_9TREM|nr:unnamed protein product [Schistosoma rodhaini]CAH8493050.1 unnamed protein product [Schistosoma rodhaini]
MENRRSLESLTVLELEELLSKQLHLRDHLLPKLPDSGEKLVSSIEKIQAILSDKKTCILNDDKNPPIANETKVTHALSNLTSNYDGNESESWTNRDPKEDSIDSLSNNLSNISISLPCDGTTSDSNEKYDNIPFLSYEEYTGIRQSLNLPCSYISSLFQWFTFSFRFVGNLVYLSVLDCSNPNRSLLRAGLVNTWFPDMNCINTKSMLNEIPSTKVSLSQPTHALHDLWLFISTTSDKNEVAVSNARTYCLICYSSNNNNNNSNNFDDIIYLSRLIRSTRHSNIVRSAQPHDCYFSNAFYALNTITLSNNNTTNNNISNSEIDKIVQSMNDVGKPDDHLSQSKTSLTHISQKFIKECYKLYELLFDKLPSPSNNDEKTINNVVLRYFSNSLEYLKLSKAKTIMWMEAPIELYLLRKLKTACNIMANKSTLASTNNKVNDFNKIPDNILRRLALVGLGRTRLTRLAGLGGWKQFAGFLSYHPSSSSSISGNSKITSHTNEEADMVRNAFVTDDLETIRILYIYFRDVYKHLDRHERCCLENNSNHHNKLMKSFPSTKLSGKQHHPFLLSYLDYHCDNDNAEFSDVTNKHDKKYKLSDKIQAWISSGNQLFDPLGHRQLCPLNINQSINLMKSVQAKYEKSRIKFKLPPYPSMPAEPINLNRYRDPSLLLLEEMDSSSSSLSTSSSDPENSDTDNDSLGLEDVD